MFAGIKIMVIFVRQKTNNMKSIYEWCYETTDENGDIIENYFADKLSEFGDNNKTDQLCLVRNEGDEINGLDDRFWAYVKDGKLPEFFSDAMGEFIGVKVPKKFHKELDIYLNRTHKITEAYLNKLKRGV